MGRRPRLRLSRALAETPDAGRHSRTFQPRLELLEDRVQLGDTILGVNAAGRIDADRLTGIDVVAGRLVNSGQLHADGFSGGQINIQSGNILNAGPITADGTAFGGNGGQVHIGFLGSYVATTAAVVSASSATGPGGHLTIDGGSTGHFYSSGRHLATGSVGGAVDLFGREVVLSGATVDASGEAGGGSVRIGGDFQGRNPAVVNAQTVTVTPASTIRADASHSGGGGRVSIWADRTTEYAGTVSARGGPAGGSGGFIEVSGHGDLNYGGSADAGARLGKSGALLLDPKNIIVSDVPVGVFPQFDLIDPHPTAGGFGSGLAVLSTGNVVVTNPGDDFGGMSAGAVYLFDGVTGALISSLVGSHPRDGLGYPFGHDGVTPLSNGNYVVRSPQWNGARGAVTWGNGSTGLSGTVSDTNSLVGTNPADRVGGGFALDGPAIGGVIPLSNGNYVVDSPSWSGSRGAVTWGNGSTGVRGTVSEANSLIGSQQLDQVGYATDDHFSVPGIVPLGNGNYLVDSPSWNGRRGAVTWGNGDTGVSGAVSDANSLVGTNFGELVGRFGVTVLTNGNYVLGNRSWNGGRGAAMWANGSRGVSGNFSDTNSLVGSNPGDAVGRFITPLSNGNYVVGSPSWNGRGAATWGSGTAGVVGLIDVSNSLVGSNQNDNVGGAVTALTNGNYLVESWNSGRGAVTWGDGGTGFSGTISDTNSLVGSNPGSGFSIPGDEVGFRVTALGSGDYVVQSPYWNSLRGAATWGNGSTGVTGTVSDANSLVGSNPGDQVGSVTPLSNGNYVVSSPSWNGNRGAVTWGNGGTGVSGTVSDTNSLVGSNPGARYGNDTGDLVGDYGVTILSNGNYLVRSLHWNGQRGAVTWGNGNTGVSGPVSDANSLVGSKPASSRDFGDQVGYPWVTPLSNGNYVVSSPRWKDNRGAVTWGNGSTGVSGPVSDANSLVGSKPGDGFRSDTGDLVGDFGVTLLTDGNYVVESLHWNGQRGAATWMSGTSGRTIDGLGTITPQNSLVGTVANAGLGDVIENPTDRTFLAVFLGAGGGRVTTGFTDPSKLTYATAQTQSVTITPAFLTRTLETGTAVVLQASDDITVNSPLTVHAGGHGGALTLQAGRSIVLNAPITTDNGALNLIANDQVASGVVDAQRDPGNAVITMAPGTFLNTGSGPLTVELRDGAGLTNSASGAITLQTVNAGSVSVINNGPSAGSDVDLGPVTSNGAQSYASANGTTNVTGNLTAADNTITFTSAVVANDGITVTAGSSAVNFAGSGTQTLQSGNGTSFVNFNHTGSGTLQLTSSLTVTGTFTNSAGTFDANGQPVTVAGPATIAAGTYLAGMASQTFSSGLSITAGIFISSSGPMSVTGGITVSGGLLSGAGTIDAVSAVGGTVAPGTASPDYSLS